VRQTRIALTRAGFNQTEQVALFRAARVVSFALMILPAMMIVILGPAIIQIFQLIMGAAA
jgi:hypothetical protein